MNVNYVNVYPDKASVCFKILLFVIANLVSHQKIENKCH